MFSMTGLKVFDVLLAYLRAFFVFSQKKYVPEVLKVNALSVHCDSGSDSPVVGVMPQSGSLPTNYPDPDPLHIITVRKMLYTRLAMCTLPLESSRGLAGSMATLCTISDCS